MSWLIEDKNSDLAVLNYILQDLSSWKANLIRWIVKFILAEKQAAQLSGTYISHLYLKDTLLHKLETSIALGVTKSAYPYILYFLFHCITYLQNAIFTRIFILVSSCSTHLLHGIQNKDGRTLPEFIKNVVQMNFCQLWQKMFTCSIFCKSTIP